jgi:hypothetical protein
VVLLEAHPRIGHDKVADLALPKGQPRAPGGALAGLEEDPAVLGHSVELPEAVVDVGHVVPDHVEDHREAGVVGGADQVAQLEG